MKRRTFIIAAAATAVAITVPAVYYSRNHKKSYNPLVMPEILGQFCDESLIRAIGEQYAGKTGENQADKIKALLLQEDNGTVVAEKDRDAVAALLKKKTEAEFSARKTLVLNGWIITQTEARQCALFSLTA